MNFPSTHRELEILEISAIEKNLVNDTKKQSKLSSYDYSNELITLDYELIQAFRKAGL